MGLELKPESQLIFYTSLFGPDDPVTNAVKEMIDAGVTFECALYTLKASKGPQVFQQTTTVGTSTLIKKTGDPITMETNRAAIRAWVGIITKKLLLGVPFTPEPAIPTVYKVSLTIPFPDKGNNILVIKAIRTVTELGLFEAKQIADSLFAGETASFLTATLEKGKEAINVLSLLGVSVKVFNAQGSLVAFSALANAETVDSAQSVVMPVQPVKYSHNKKDKVIPLREAKVIGQKVQGTSNGSVYYCVAFNPRVSIAARIYKKGTVSIRAEWQNITPEEKTKLEEAGLGFKGEYASAHFETGEVPPARLLGAFLLGSGVEFDEQVKTTGELVVE